MNTETFDRVVELASRRGQLQAELERVERELAALRPGGEPGPDLEDEDDAPDEVVVTPRKALATAPTKRKKSTGAVTGEQVLELFKSKAPRDLSSVDVAQHFGVDTKTAGNRMRHLINRGDLKYVTRGRYRAKK